MSTCDDCEDFDCKSNMIIYFPICRGFKLSKIKE